MSVHIKEMNDQHRTNSCLGLFISFFSSPSSQLFEVDLMNGHESSVFLLYNILPICQVYYVDIYF
uniref:Uncharacterized protein n=1 Tax=Lepeophtheirus salmonis TaxID=72036 RepID=A0A0K2U066_LEPSM